MLSSQQCDNKGYFNVSWHQNNRCTTGQPSSGLSSHNTQWHHISPITPFWHATVEKAVKYNIPKVGALGGKICVTACFVQQDFSFPSTFQWDWTSISASCMFFKNASFPISVFHLQCHSVPILLTVLTSDIVSVPQDLTISNPLCPWTVLNVRNVHSLKADRLKKSPYTIICCTSFGSSSGLLCGFRCLSLCLCGYFSRCFGYFNGPKICILHPVGPVFEWQLAQSASCCG